MFNKFPFHRILVLFTLFSMSLTACNAAPTLTAPELTPAPDFTPTPRPTEIPTATPEPTNTPDPLAGAPEGATGKDSKGNYIKTVEENGHTYEYVYNAELQTGIREIITLPLLDMPKYNYIPYKIFIAEDVLDEQSLITMSHRDMTMSDIPSGGTYTPNPLRSAVGPALRDRYFAGDLRQLTDKEQQSVIQDEMLGNGEKEHEQAYLPILLSDGNTEAKIKLSPDTGIIMTIMTPEKIKELGGDRVSKWTYGSISKGIFFTFYSEVYGVDEKGNMLVRFALNGSWSDSKLTEEIIRVALFSIPANLVEHIDQSKQGVTDFAITLGHVSNWTQADGVTPDLVIERVTASSETPTPTPTP